ncbi:MAG: hypothetical protein GW941_01505 [Candidatus Pacebacteria bacterium]|nr:hypothetical protein [Candidatus Paceibacterota bacterium]
MSDSQLNSTTVIFPNLEKDGIVLEPVFGDLEFHALRLLLDHLATSEPLSVEDISTPSSLDEIGANNHESPRNSHILNRILGSTNRINRTRMLESLQKRRLTQEQQSVLNPEIEKPDELWLTSILLTMLAQVGVGLTVSEREELIANIEWFIKN